MNAIDIGQVIGLLVAIGTSAALTGMLPRSQQGWDRSAVGLLATAIRGALVFSVSACVLVVATFLAINIVEHHRETFSIEGAYETLGLVHWSSLLLTAALAEQVRTRMRPN